MKTKSLPFIMYVLMVFGIGCNTGKTEKSLIDFVDPYIGNVGHLLQPTRPTAQLPNQAIRMHPVRNDYLDDQISYFPLTLASHRQTTLFGVLPGTGDPEKESWKARQTYDHDLEIARPYYFSTYFIDEEITTEFVPGRKVDFFVLLSRQIKIRD